MLIIAAVIAAALIFYYSGFFKNVPPPAQTPSTSENASPATSTESSASQSPSTPTPTSSAALFVPPIANWQARVTKKPFGIYITPQTSPVQPEKFKGYHTGVDFETTPAEQNTDVPVYAVCSGTMLAKQTVSGYGGAVVEICNLDGQTVTILYGHLKISSVSLIEGQAITAGQPIGILGKAYSAETDGERKHLHLGIHLGSAINWLGYVSDPSQLADWLDAMKYF